MHTPILQARDEQETKHEFQSFASHQRRGTGVMIRSEEEMTKVSVRCVNE